MARKAAPKVTAYEGTKGTTYRVRVRYQGRQTTETFASYQAALTFAEMVKHEGVEAAIRSRDEIDLASPSYVPTLAEMVVKHVEELTGVDPRTRDDYRSLAERSFLPILGRLRVNKITRAHVAKFINARDGVVAPKTIKNEHALLSGVLESAVLEGHLSSNPARGTRLPRSGEEEVDDIRFLTHGEFDRLLVEVAAFWRPFVVTLFGTGLRFGEITALQVQDVNTETKTLRVMRAWKKDRNAPGGRRLGPPKSKASRRMIWLDDVTLGHIEPLMAGKRSTDLIFTTTTGKVVSHSNFRDRVWVPACVRAGLASQAVPFDGPRVHDARHTHASWLIANGVRLEVVQDRLGHEDYMTTRRIYAHLLPDIRRDAGLAAAVAFAQTALGSGTSLAIER